jgi:hypothetical protein
MPLRVKLWLGRLFDWDKGGVRAVLFLMSAFALILGAECAYNDLVREHDPSPDVPCNSACIDDMVEEIIRENPPPPMNRFTALPLFEQASGQTDAP